MKHIYKLASPEKAKERGISSINHDGKTHRVDLTKPGEFTLETEKLIAEPGAHGLKLIRTI